jgi:hypothetical protein
MHEQCQESGTDDNASGIGSNRAQNAIDDGIEHAGVGHDPEIQDREHEHGRH